MNICITSQGDTLEAQLDPRFGRCQYFMFLDTATNASTAMENPYKDGGGSGGAGNGTKKSECCVDRQRRTERVPDIAGSGY